MVSVSGTTLLLSGETMIMLLTPLKLYRHHVSPSESTNCVLLLVS
jgi:hypothetical protein